MTNYKLWELTSPASTDAVYELAREVAEDKATANGYMTFHTLREDEFDERAIAVCYAVHRVLWHLPHTPDNTHPPYTHRLVSGTSISAAVAKAVGAHPDHLFGANKAKVFCQRVYDILAANQLLIRVGGGAAKNYFYIRDWPQGFTPRWASRNQNLWLSYKDEVDIARQQQRAEQLAGEVKTYFKVSAIPLPKPEPDSVMDYLVKVLAAVKHLEAENADLRAKLAEATTVNEWQGVVDGIMTALGGDDDSTQREGT